MQKLFENWRNFLVERAQHVTSIDHAFKILDLPRNASREDAKKVFRAVAKEFHPDIYKGNDPAEAKKRLAAAMEAWQAIQDPRGFKYALGGGGAGSAERRSAGGDSGAWHSRSAYWRSAGPMAPMILKSLQTIIDIVSQAIETNQSVKVDGIRISGDIVIPREDWDNLRRFMTHYQYENLRIWVMGGGAAIDFVNNKIMSTLKSVSISPKFGSGKEDLQNFVDILKRVVPGGQAKEEPADDPGRPEPEPETAGSQGAWDWAAKAGRPMSDEEMADILKKMNQPWKE